MYKTLKDAYIEKKRVLLRLDLNVPIKDNKIIDSLRIEKAIPSILFLLNQKAKIIIISHLGRPKGKDINLSLKIVSKKLSEILCKKIQFLDNCIGEKVENICKNMHPGNIVMLENLRFHKEEEENNKDFAKKIASLAEIYVNDAFGVLHRKHASIVKITKYLDSYCGLLVENEISQINKIINSPKKPFTAIIGGKKISDKILLLKSLLNKIDKLIISGAMSYTFLKVLGKKIGSSFIDEKMINKAKEITNLALKKNIEIILPKDHIVTNKINEIKIENEISTNYIGCDIGPKSIKEIKINLNKSKTIFWNGPLGIYENKIFSKGTKEIAKHLGQINKTVIIGGGDSAAAIRQIKIEEKITHVSTGGGACLKLIETGNLIGMESLKWT